MGGNKWRLRVWFGKDGATGKRLSASTTFYGTKEHAELYLAEVIDRVRKGNNQPFKREMMFGETVPTVRLQTSLTGAVSELVVCIDLLRRGYDVYRSVAATGACDVIALKRGCSAPCRVEVKTATKGRYGDLKFNVPEWQKDCHDVVALTVLRDGSIEYQPDIEKWFEGRENSENRARGNCGAHSDPNDEGQGTRFQYFT